MYSILYYHPDRYSRPNTREAEEHYRNNIPAQFDVVQDWREFVNKMSHHYDLVALHSDLVNNDPIELGNIIKTITTLLKVYDCNSKIAVCINKECSTKTITQLKQTRVCGIVPSRLSWSLDEATTAWRECVSGEYWPEHIIKSLEHNSFVSIAYICPEDHTDSSQCFDDVKVDRYSSLADLTLALQSRPDYLAFHTGLIGDNKTSASEFMLMLTTLVKQLNVKMPKLCFAFEKDTHINVIKDLQKNNITLFVPTAKSYGLEEVKDAHDVILGGATSYYPKHLISKLPGNQKLRRTSNKPTLTPRQREIYDLISRRGLRNKQIAKVLNISESTVKIHVSGIFKVLCVRNRTQLALSKIN